MVLLHATEQDAKGTNAGAESEFGLTYTMGALSVAYARDTGQNGKFGDEAETVTTITYDWAVSHWLPKALTKKKQKFQQHSHSKLNNLVWMERAAYGLLFFYGRLAFAAFGAFECGGRFYPG